MLRLGHLEHPLMACHGFKRDSPRQLESLPEDLIRDAQCRDVAPEAVDELCVDDQILAVRGPSNPLGRPSYFTDSRISGGGDGQKPKEETFGIMGV